MSNIEVEIITYDDFNGDKEDAKNLVQEFIQQAQYNVEPKKAKIIDKNGDELEQIQGYARRSSIPWDSIAILMMSDPQGTIQLFKWLSNHPGLTFGYSTIDGTRLKVFSDSALVEINANLNIELNVVGKHTENKNVVEVPEKDWRKIYDAYDKGDIDSDMPDENEIGL